MLENFWKDKYPSDVPSEINPDQFPNIQAVIRESCQRFADKPAFTCLDKTLTWGDVYTLSGAFAAYLQEHTDLQPGDRIVQVGTQPIAYWDEVGTAVQAQAAEGQALALVYERGGERREVGIVPRLDTSEAQPRWVLGIPPPAMGVKFDALFRLTGATFGMLWRMVNGSASLKNISGPISIAQYANDSAQMGVAWFLFFLAVLSLSLCIMNLLPIPILDGGHLLYYLIEMVKGSPVSERALIAGQYLGLALLAGLMGIAFYNDILGLMPG